MLNQNVSASLCISQVTGLTQHLFFCLLALHLEVRAQSIMAMHVLKSDKMLFYV